jgi:hypothetical protein
MTGSPSRPTPYKQRSSAAPIMHQRTPTRTVGRFHIGVSVRNRRNGGRRKSVCQADNARNDRRQHCELHRYFREPIEASRLGTGQGNGALFFRKGLPTNLHRRILDREHIPVSIDEWESTARAEVEKARRIKATFGPRGRRGKRDPDPDAGVIRTSSDCPKKKEPGF